MKRLFYAVPVLAMLCFAACDDKGKEPPQKEAPKWESRTNEYSGNPGETVTVTATVKAENGLDKIDVAIPAWSAGSGASADEILATGSPRSFPVNYSVAIPEDADAGDKTVRFTLKDVQGKSTVQDVKVTVKMDNTAPDLQIVSPENGAIFSPSQQLTFNLVATDNLKMKDVVISCAAIDYEESFLPGEDPAKVTVNKSLPLTDMNGEYTFGITATDAQGNAATESVRITVTFDSKPRIVNNLRNDVCGVVGGKLVADFSIESNILHPLTEVKFECAAFGVNESVPLEAGQWQAELKLEIPVGDDVPEEMTRDIDYTITAKNDKPDETTVHSGKINLFSKVFIIGKGTMAREKPILAIPMTQSGSDKNIFEAVTWIDVAGDGIKFMDNRGTDQVSPDFIWGTDSEGNVISDNSNLNAEGCNYIVPEAKGYHKLTFNPATWEYSVTPHTPPAAVKHELVYLNGAKWYWWDEQGAKWQDWGENWGGVLPMKKHPDTPHRFYMDIRTYPSDVACIVRFFGQPDLEGGTYYGITDVYSGAWVDTWWEWAGPLYARTTYNECSYLTGKGRLDNLTRITVDTYLNYVSWISIEEELSWGWSIFPEKYTGDWK